MNMFYVKIIFLNIKPNFRNYFIKERDKYNLKVALLYMYACIYIFGDNVFPNP